MFYFKSRGLCIHQDFISGEWGEFVRYIEVADDQFAVRQVEVFKNGKLLRYDRSHWCDDYGMLVALKFSRKPKWSKFFKDVEEVTKSNFETLWKSAVQPGTWDLQVTRSRMLKWGEFRTE